MQDTQRLHVPFLCMLPQNLGVARDCLSGKSDKGLLQEQLISICT